MAFSSFLAAALPLLMCHVVLVLSMEDGLARTPPMGWRSWNAFEGNINDRRIRSVIRAITQRHRLVDGIPTSLADVGYLRVGIDDGWQACQFGWDGSFHAQDGTPLVNATRFPDGFANLVAHGHNAGLLMDFYQINCICMDTYTLNRNRTWARLSWEGNARQLRKAGFDGLKIDNCGDDDGAGFLATVSGLRKTNGKPILIENCNQAHGIGPPRGLPTDGSDNAWCNFHLFRTGGDIRSNFDDTMRKLQTTIPFQDEQNPISRPGCWAFPDMLEVGNFESQKKLAAMTFDDGDYDQKNAVEVEWTELAIVEARTHFGAWCIISSPLMLSFDVTDQKRLDSVWDIITNREAIAINQKWDGHPGRLVKTTDNDTIQVWAKRLPNHEHAILFLNRGVHPASATVSWIELGLLNSLVYDARDVWKKGKYNNTNSTNISVENLGKHDSILVRLSHKIIEVVEYSNVD